MRTDDSEGRETAGITAKQCCHQQPNSAYRCTKKRGHGGMHGEHRVEGGGFAQTWFDDESQQRSVAEALANTGVLQNATLPERMRAAADTLVEANIRHDTAAGVQHDRAVATSTDIPWDAIRLRESADRWEAADQEAAAAEELVNALAYRLARLIAPNPTGPTRLIAEALIADGWIKEEAP